MPRKSNVPKRIVQFLIIGLVIAAVFFANVEKPAQIKSDLLSDVEALWGQAYSSNIGWVNFYCDGAGNTQPEFIRTYFPAKGAATVPDACSTTAYGVTYDTTTKTFSGEAYSSNYGWFDMNGLTTDESMKIHGSTDGAGIDPYNFGTTDFQKGPLNPGIYYHSDEAYFCGFAYSDAVGYISFCDPQTKDLPPENISKPGFDWNTYAVYAGTAPTDDTLPPTVTTAGKVFAATDNYNETLWFQDDATPVASVEVKIMDSNGVEQTYNADYFDSENRRASVDISGHDFHIVGNYDLTFTSCDILGHCSDPAVEGDGKISDFFQVVAAAPDWPGNSYFEFDSATPAKVSDGIESHFVRAVLIDEYGNPVISVTDVKEVKTSFTFVNTTELDQINTSRPPGDDSAVFNANEFAFSQEGGTTTGWLTELANGDGISQVNVSSYAPTSDGYTPIENDAINLWFDEMSFEVNALNGYVNVGESSGTYASVDDNRKFTFSPTLVATPEALVWNSGTGAYEVDPSGVENITINSPKRFGLSLQNDSGSVAVGSPELGVAVNSGVGSNVVWANGVIEKAGGVSDLSEALDLDTDSNSTFDATLDDLSTWISGVASSSSNGTLRFRMTPELTAAASAVGDMNTILRNYICYALSGKNICHRSERLEKGAATEASLYNPSIEILGSIRSSSNVGDKRSDVAVNQSIGDFVQSELAAEMDRNTSSLTKNADADYCGKATITNLTSFWTSASCKHLGDNVLYFKGGDVTLNLSGDLPDGAKTIVVENGDLHIQGDLTYAGADDSFGVIVLGGDIFVYPGVSDIAGVFYSDGSVISVNASGQYGEDTSSTCNGSSGFCDRSYELRNQLYWQGLIATQNTIGGSDLATPECPGGETCSRDEARIYDLTYLRTYHPDSGGTTAYAGSDAALVVEYNSRIQNNLPPLFEISTGESSGETGY